MISLKNKMWAIALIAVNLHSFNKVFLVNSASEVAHFSNKSLSLEMLPFTYYEIEISQFTKILETGDSWPSAQITVEDRTFDFYFDKTTKSLSVGYSDYVTSLGDVYESDNQLFIFINQKNSSFVPLPYYNNISFLVYRGYPDLTGFDHPELAVQRDLFRGCKRLEPIS